MKRQPFPRNRSRDSSPDPAQQTIAKQSRRPGPGFGLGLAAAGPARQILYNKVLTLSQTKLWISYSSMANISSVQSMTTLIQR